MSAPIDPPPPARGSLTDTFLGRWRGVDPGLGADALAELTDGFARRKLPPPVSDEAEAIIWIWEEDIPLDGPAVGAFLRRQRGAASAFSYARLILETRVRKILRVIADDIREARYRLIATHPRTHEPFVPDPALIETLSGSDRSRDRIPTDYGPITNLRLEPPQPQQPTPPAAPETKPPRRPTATAVKAAVQHALEADGALSAARLWAAVKKGGLPGATRAQVRAAIETPRPRGAPKKPPK